MKIRTMLQGFEWYLPADQHHWERIGEEARHLEELGFTDVWLPPAYKGIGGGADVGYGVYDLYDLGEFEQKGSRATKYGTREQYLEAVRSLHSAGLQVLADIVLNHRMGADLYERVQAHMYWPDRRISGYKKTKMITAQTGFTFPKRRMHHSDFVWNHTHFTGVDINVDNEYEGGPMNGGIPAVYKLSKWSKNVDHENENYDYLMGADVNFANPEVREELKRWGRWYVDTVGFDGVRIDAVKHIDHGYFTEWLAEMRRHTGKEFFAVGEYWNGDPKLLRDYLDHSGKCMSLFDVALHYNLHQASLKCGEYDLTRIFDGTLVQSDPWHAVTFVDNHDTQPGQMLESWIRHWFKPLAYALILLRQDGFPCVFYGDLYGTNSDYSNKDRPVYPEPRLPELERLLELRKEFGFGGQQDYNDGPNLYGWTRESGMAVVMSNRLPGSLRMQVGKPGEVYYDRMGQILEPVTIDRDGFGTFPTRACAVSVWVPKK